MRRTGRVAGLLLLSLVAVTACGDDGGEPAGLEPSSSATAGLPTGGPGSSGAPSAGPTGAQPTSPGSSGAPTTAPTATRTTSGTQPTPRVSPTRRTPTAAPTSTAAGRLHTIRTVFGNRFEPATLTIRVGDRVRVVYADSPQTFPHTWTRNRSPMRWDYDVSSGMPTTPALRFGGRGSFSFICSPHESQGMVGTITVR